MKKGRFIAVSILGAAFAVQSAFAAATIDEKTQLHFGGFLGGIINVFGGKATREGIQSTSVVKGDRRLRTAGGSGELVDLKQEKVYRIDFDRKSYTVVTFEQLRQELRDAEANARKQSRESSTPSERPGKEYEVEVTVKDTGAKETINGFNTHQVVTTVTVHEKGVSLERGGGAVLTSDMWIGPRIAGMRELEDFERRYVQAVYGQMIGSEDMQRMAMLAATSPMFVTAMKKFYDKRASFDGTPIRTELKFEGVPDPRESTSSEEGEPSASRVIGGLLSKARRNKSEEAESNRSLLFDSKTEVLKATESADANALQVPAGFRQR